MSQMPVTFHIDVDAVRSIHDRIAGLAQAVRSGGRMEPDGYMFEGAPQLWEAFREAERRLSRGHDWFDSAIEVLLRSLDLAVRGYEDTDQEAATAAEGI